MSRSDYFSICYKLCDERYNPLYAGDTIRFGTLAGYRIIENEKLRDDVEGISLYHFVFDDVFVPRQDREFIKYLAGLDGDPGNISLPPGHYNRRIRQVSEFGGRVSGDFLLQYTYPNSYVLSLTRTLRSSEEFNYNSYWAIDLDQWHAINKSLVAAFYELYFSKAFTLTYGNGQTFYGPFNIEISFLKVAYDKRLKRYESNSSEAAGQIARLLWRAPYSKPPKFQPEEEIRIIVHFTSKSLALQVGEGPIDIDPKYLRDFIVDHGSIERA